MLQYLTPSVLMTLLKVQQGNMIEIAGELCPTRTHHDVLNIIDFHRALQILADRFIAGEIHLDTTISHIGQYTPLTPPQETRNY